MEIPKPKGIVLRRLTNQSEHRLGCSWQDGVNYQFLKGGIIVPNAVDIPYYTYLIILQY